MSEVSFSSSVALLQPGITVSPEEASNAWKVVKLFADALPTYVHTIHELAACSAGLISIAIAAHALYLAVLLDHLEQGQLRFPIITRSLVAKVALAASTAFCLSIAALMTVGVFDKTHTTVDLKDLFKIISLHPMDDTSALRMWKMLKHCADGFPAHFYACEQFSVVSGVFAVLALFGSVILDPETERSSPFIRLKNRVVITSLALAAVVSVGTSDYIRICSPIK